MYASWLIQAQLVPGVQHNREGPHLDAVLSAAPGQATGA